MLHGIGRRIRMLLRASRFERELDDEMRLHVSLREERLRASGLSEEAARERAQQRFGNLLRLREESLKVAGVQKPAWSQGIGGDVRLAMRTMGAAPLLSAVAILSLALGIGATTAIFSIINSIYFRPLPVERPEELVYVAGPTRTGRTGVAVWRQLLERPDLFAGLAAYAGAQFNVSATSEARWVDGFWVNGAFFRTLGVRPFAGRLLSEEDDRPGAPAAVVISHSLWMQRFGGALEVMGRPLSVDGVPLTVVGVAPPQFFGPTVGRSFDVIVPFGASPLIASIESDITPDVIGRLWPGQSIAQANAALEVLGGNDGPGAGGAERRIASAAEPPRALPAATGQPPIGFRQQYRTPLITLLAVVSLVLLIACANIANLMLARSASRRIDLSVRRALGATRWRLVRQCLVESAVLAAAGAAAGVVVAFWASRLLVLQLAREDALTAGLTMYGSARLFLDLSFDGRVLALTTVVTAATGLLFGIAPALRAAAADPIDALKASGSAGTQTAASALSRLGGLRVSATQGILVVQVAISVALLVTAGLFLRTFTTLLDLPLGFDADRVLVVDVHTARTGSSTRERVASAERVAAAVRTLPSVSAVSLSAGAPPVSWGVRDAIEISGVDPAPDPSASVVLVSPEWFRTFGVPLVAGRELTDGDRRGAPRVAVVNQAFVRALLRGANPLGRTIVSFEAPIEIVGVVGDILAAPRSVPPPVVFVPMAQAEGRLEGVLDLIATSYGLAMGVRPDDRAPGVVSGQIAEHVARSEPRAVLTFRSPRDQIAALMVRERVLAILSGFFGMLALLLSALGLYGVASYAVVSQLKEMAVRVALGASARRAVGLVLGRVLAPVAAGLAIGLVLAAWATRFVSALLYGVEPRDLTTFGTAALILSAVGILAAWLPTHRAVRMDPAVVLRYE